MQLPHNIYVHVPFCMSKCNYCAFFSRACINPDWDTYANNIISELEHWGALMGRISVPTIFFGGGTPSLMPAHIFARIIDKINSEFNIYTDCEITLESNPGTIDKNKLNEFINIGVNRLSVGVQSFDDEKLKFLGRRHSVCDAMNLINVADGAKIRVSADFIYGLPGDNVTDVIQMCNQINNLGITHCSMYELTIEPSTPFGKMNLDMPSNDTMADMYNAIDDTLKLHRYEVSNYATPGNQCRHNVNVWDGAPYIGIGRGAAGRVIIDGQWYEQMGNGEKFVPISNATRAIERVITGLRTTRGVYLDTDVQKIINMDYVRANPDLFVQNPDNRIAVTKRGMLILDDIVLNTVG